VPSPDAEALNFPSAVAVPQWFVFTRPTKSYFHLHIRQIGRRLKSRGDDTKPIPSKP
jgi:hypothetical protein